MEIYRSIGSLVPTRLMQKLIPTHFRIRANLFRLLKQVDKEKFESLRKKYRGSDFGASKHWQLKKRLALALKHAIKLRLHESAPKRILDLGTGCGYFPFVCNSFGHQTTGLDISIPMYGDLCELLSVERQEYVIQPYRELPTPSHRFDMITALLVRFNTFPSGGVWGAKEWEYLLRDLASHQLTSDGSAYFVLVKDPLGRYCDPKLLELFATAGAKISKNIVYFESLKAFA